PVARALHLRSGPRVCRIFVGALSPNLETRIGSPRCRRHLRSSHRYLVSYRLARRPLLWTASQHRSGPLGCVTWDIGGASEVVMAWKEAGTRLRLAEGL